MAAEIPYRENELLQNLAQGDEGAFRRIYDNYWSSVYSTAKRYTKSESLAADIVQEVFVIIWNKRAHFTGVFHLECYLMAMARNLTYKTMRKLAFEDAARNHLAAELINNLDEDPLLEKQYEELIQQAVSQLPRRQREIFQLAKVEGLSQNDIAAELNISRLTVKSHMAKALQFIRRCLQPHVRPL